MLSSNYIVSLSGKKSLKAVQITDDYSLTFGILMGSSAVNNSKGFVTRN